MQDELKGLQEEGYCLLKRHYPGELINACRNAFWPDLVKYLEGHGNEANRGPQRHYVPMLFEPPCFAREFFFDKDVLRIVYELMGNRVVADQWGCDIALQGSDYQGVHVDHQRPLYEEQPDLSLPAYMLVVSFGLGRITFEDGPIEIAPGTHRMPRTEGLRAVESGVIRMRPVPMEIGDVLIRHPWALHRGSPNLRENPRALVSIRYVRKWYVDDSREVRPLPQNVWRLLTHEQQSMMRFPRSVACHEAGDHFPHSNKEC